MNWNNVLPESELPEGARKVVKIGEQTVLVLRHDNKLHAVTNKCPHLSLPLNKGKITEDNAIVCPWHHSAFDLDSGDVKAWSPWPPVVGKLLGCLTKEKALAVYPVKAENGSIWVQL
ncbi:MAG: Rieske (2Fe-2S) protein [Gammaproteobacteria bacterium]|nr:Rieske (2Fe-2S) protein [Gammaproteobacteria bacterium]